MTLGQWWGGVGVGVSICGYGHMPKITYSGPKSDIHRVKKDVWAKIQNWSVRTQHIFSLLSFSSIILFIIIVHWIEWKYPAGLWWIKGIETCYKVHQNEISMHEPCGVLKPDLWLSYLCYLFVYIYRRRTCHFTIIIISDVTTKWCSLYSPTLWLSNFINQISWISTRYIAGAPGKFQMFALFTATDTYLALLLSELLHVCKIYDPVTRWVKNNQCISNVG